MEIIEVRVGIADLKITNTPNKIMTVGLGSCIGIVMYDNTMEHGGLAHIMLPDSSQFSNINNPLKFADLAIPILIDELIKMGATKNSLKAKIAGGASMFNFSDKNVVMDIGNRNIISVKETLKKCSIPLVSEDVGGNKGRTIIYNTLSGTLMVRTVGLPIKEI